MRDKQPVDACKVRSLVVDNPGITAAEISDKLGLDFEGIRKSGVSRLKYLRARLIKEGWLFIQKNGVTVRWFTLEYARKNFVSSKSGYVSESKPVTLSVLDDEAVDVLARIEIIDMAFLVTQCGELSSHLVGNLLGR